MPPYSKEVEKLAPLETFDPQVFQGDSKFPQSVCDIVLSLALVYNDLRDIFLGQVLLASVKPDSLAAITPERGQFSGLGLHLARLQAGLVRELTELIQDNQDVIASAPFQRLVSKLDKKAKASWKALVDASANKPAGSPLTMLLLLARNKVAFHYDRKVIGKGYALRFLSNPPRQPYVSRGSSMSGTRFYYADAAAEAYILSVTDPQTVGDFLSGKSQVLDDVNRALQRLVVAFVNVRGYAWRSS